MARTSRPELGEHGENAEGTVVSALKEFAATLTVAKTTVEVSAAAWGLVEALDKMT